MDDIGLEARGHLLERLVIVGEEDEGRLLAVLVDIGLQHAVDFPAGPVKDGQLGVGRMGGDGTATAPMRHQEG